MAQVAIIAEVNDSTHHTMVAGYIAHTPSNGREDKMYTPAFWSWDVSAVEIGRGPSVAVMHTKFEASGTAKSEEQALAAYTAAVEQARQAIADVPTTCAWCD